MPGAYLWGWDAAAEDWVKVLVNADGKLIIDPSEILEDDPTDGEVAKAPTSNWAYDHKAAKTGVHLAGANNLLNTGDVDDTPVDDATTVPVSSNWAYDHAKSKCHVSYASGQYIAASGEYSYLLFDTEVYDELGEFDNSVKTGAATATSASHLVDTTNNQFTAGDVGSYVWNTTDNTYAKVTAYNSPSDVTLDEDIMANGEGYKLYRSRFTATLAGTYLVCLFVQLNGNSADGGYITGVVNKNEATTLVNIAYAPANNLFLGVSVTGVLKLAVNDYITFAAFQDIAAAKQLLPAATSAYAVITKVQ